MEMPIANSLPLLELDILRTFVAIAETQSFSAAASVVNRTPSAVSMQVKKLEDNLGRPMFVRNPRSVTLTADGETLLAYARRLLAINREAVSQFVTPDISGTVRIGAIDDVGERMLPGILKRFARTHPDIMVDVAIEQSGTLRQRFAEGRVDIALTSCVPDDPPAGEEIIFEEQLVWAGAKGGSAHLRCPLPVSMWNEGCAWRAGAISGLKLAGTKYRIAYTSAHVTGQKAAIVSDLAIAPMPLSFLTDELVILGTDDGLPEIGTYGVGMLVQPDAEAAVLAAADHIRATFAEVAEQSARDARAPRTKVA